MTDTTAVESGEPIPVTDEESAAGLFHNILHPEEQEADNEAEAEEAEEAPQEDTEGDESEAESEESVEVPSTINELAEQYGVDVNELASHLMVKVDGEDVPLSDLRDGHMRRADFNRRMQEVAAERKSVEAERGKLQGHLSQRLQELDNLVQVLGQQIQPPQDLNRLLEEDPAEYVRAKARIDAQNQALWQAQQFRQQQTQEQAREAKQRADAYRQEQQKALVKEIPDLSKPEKLSAFEKDLTGYLERLNFTQEEVSSFFGGAWDHRHILIMRDAANYAKFKEGETKLKKKVKSLPRVQKPGTAEDKQSRASDAKTSALTKLKRQGTDKAAVEWMKTRLG